MGDDSVSKPRTAELSTGNGDYEAAGKRWQEEFESGRRPLNRKFTTGSMEDVKPLYTPEDTGGVSEAGGKYLEKLGFPGQYPYTRGVRANMYRGKIWTMRQFSGFATPRETNQRYHYLLGAGQTGLSVAFDLPTLTGHHSDSDRSPG